jgi:hypothetical protein
MRRTRISGVPRNGCTEQARDQPFEEQAAPARILVVVEGRRYFAQIPLY